MKRLKEFMDKAETCRDMAAKTSDPARQVELLELAAKWVALAEERDRLLQIQKRLASLP